MRDSLQNNRCPTPVLLPLVLSACVLGAIAPAKALATAARDAVYKNPLHNFLTGADLSELPYHESQGVRYFDDGKAADLLEIARRNHWNVIRVRLWVNPDSRPDYAVSSLENVTALGKRIRAHRLKFLLDIHYSDTWADPAHQKKPAAWDALPFPKLLQQVHDYTRDVIVHLRQNHAMPDLVQIGNETANGFLYGSGLNGAGPEPGGGFWENTPGGWERFLQLFQAGLAGVRDGSSPRARPLTILHIPDGQSTGYAKWYFTTLESHEQSAGLHLNYDVIGLSYYPAEPWDRKAGYSPWHLAHLVETMDYLARTLHKPVLIVETNWLHEGHPADMPGEPEFPFTPEGQADYYRALIRAVKAAPDGLGAGVLAWDTDSLNWNSLFDSQGNALPAVRALGTG